jgi:hypothetical protein
MNFLMAAIGHHSGALLAPQPRSQGFSVRWSSPRPHTEALGTRLLAPPPPLPRNVSTPPIKKMKICPWLEIQALSLH